MGMFDKPVYLTGKGDSYANVGETFWLHGARVDGTTVINGVERPQAKLKVSKDRNGDTEIVLTSGAGVTGQIQRMDDTDRAKLPMQVRLDAIPSGKGNPTNVLTPADQPPPDEDDIPF